MQRLLLPLVIAVGCRADPTDDTRAPPAPKPVPPVPTDPPAPCGTIDAVEVTTGILPTQRAFAIALSDPAPVALLCTGDEDPREEHLLEEVVPAIAHTLRLDGLAYDTAYTCEIAAVCEVPGAPSEVRFTTAPVAGGIPTFEVQIDPVLGMTGAYTLMPFAVDVCASPARVVGIWDPDGAPRWGYVLPTEVGVDIEALLDPPSGTILWGGGGEAEGAPRIVDLWEGDLYVTSFPDDPRFSHDAKRLPDGRILTLEWRDNALGAESWLGFGARVHDPVTGRIDADFDSQTLVDAGVLRTAGGLLDHDPYHANSVEWIEGAEGAELVVSLCFDRTILALDPATGAVRWKFGAGLGWTLSDEQGLPLDDSALPQCQHGIEVDGDRLLLYDNGRDRGESQAVEWQLDPATLTATRTWHWTEPGWFVEIWGDVDELGPERVLVTEANRCGSPRASSIVEVDRATGGVASRVVLPVGAGTYRAERYDGCDLFANTRWCPALSARRAALDAFFTPQGP